MQWFYNTVALIIFLGFALAIWMLLDEFVITPLMRLLGPWPSASRA